MVEVRQYGSRPILLMKSFEINSQVFWKILGKEEIIQNESDQDSDFHNKTHLLLIKEPEVSLDQLVLPEKTINQLEDALWQYENGERIYEEYGLLDKLPYGRGTIMLFYGPPGTGKTATSEAVAKKLGKKIGIVNYARIYDCWVGNSEKHIQRVFKEAKDNDCILLFDEAEATFGERLVESKSTDRMHNLMTNVLMQELERFLGMVILTTNRELVIDKAFERRILLKLKFDLPQAEMRIKIWELFLKDCPQIAPDVSFEELGRRYQFTGGKIKNVVVKTIFRCAKTQKLISMADLITSAEEELKSEFGKEKNIGFNS